VCDALAMIAIGEEGVARRKDIVRQNIWDYMEHNNLVEDYPRPCHQKIPHFKGCKRAAEKVSRLREFISSRTIKINPSLAQMHLRFLTLKHRKKLLVPSPALGEEFYYLVDPELWPDKKVSRLYKAASKAGAKKEGIPLNEDWSEVDRIDLVVVASVAVGTNGVRLGKGLGYAELEWGILYELGMVNSETTVLTTVHDCQVVPNQDLPVSLMTPHDLPVDIVVTPNRTINVRRPLAKPSCGVLWDQVTQQKLEEIPVLKKLKSCPYS